MKKFLAIALVAALVATSAFAGFSGYAEMDLGYNTKNKTYGMSKDAALSVDLDVLNEPAEKIGEGDIYAGIKATIKLRLVDAKNEKLNPYVYNAGNSVANYGVGVFASIDEAYVTNGEWKVAITGTASSNPVDFAKSAVDTYKTTVKDAFNTVINTKDAAVTMKAGYTSNYGVVATYADYTVGLGFNGDFDASTVDTDAENPAYVSGKTPADVKAYNAYTAYVLTPAYEVAEGITVKAGVVASQAKPSWNADATPKAVKYPETNAGVSASVAYASDVISATVASDIAYTKGAEKPVHFDVAVNAKYDFITFDAYYTDEVTVKAATKNNPADKTATTPVVKKSITEADTTYKTLLSGQIAADLTGFDVPVTLKGKAKDVLGAQKLSGEIVTTIDAFKVTVGAGCGIKAKTYSVSGAVEYKADLYTAKAGVEFAKTYKADDAQLYATASVASDKIVNGATLTLAYKTNSLYDGTVTTNLLKGTDKGKFVASAKIAF